MRSSMKLVGAVAKERTAGRRGGESRGTEINYYQGTQVLRLKHAAPDCRILAGFNALACCLKTTAMLSTGNVVRGIQGRLQHAGNAARIARRSGNRRVVRRYASLLLPGLGRGTATATTGTSSTTRRAGYSTTAPAERGRFTTLDDSRLSPVNSWGRGDAFGYRSTSSFCTRAEKESYSRQTLARRFRERVYRHKYSLELLRWPCAS